MADFPGAPVSHAANTRVSWQVCTIRWKGLESTSTCDMEWSGQSMYFNTTLGYLWFHINYELWINYLWASRYAGACVCMCVVVGVVFKYHSKFQVTLSSIYLKSETLIPLLGIFSLMLKGFRVSLPKNMPLWHVNSFGLEAIQIQQSQEKLFPFPELRRRS